MRITFVNIVNSSAALFLAGIALLSCAQKDRRSSGSKVNDRVQSTVASPASQSREPGPNEADLEAAPEDDWPRPLQNKINDKSFGHLLCESGPQAVAKSAKANLDNVFKVACNKNSPTKMLAQLFSSAYSGSNEPAVKTIYFNVNDYFITHFTYGYAVKAKLSSPAKFSGLPIYDTLGKGVSSGDSRVYIRKTSERSFPGRGVVTEINLDYDLPYAEGSALYDKRSTQMNTYLLNEATQDINITVEHLLNPESNKIYHTSNSLIIGVKGDQGETYLVYIVELILTNRFDPNRVQRTLSELAKRVQETVYQVSQSAE